MKTTVVEFNNTMRCGLTIAMMNYLVVGEERVDGRKWENERRENL
jgi:hypothetical protein